LIWHKCQGDPDPRVIRSVVPSHPVPDPLLRFCRFFKVILFTPPLGITRSIQPAPEPAAGVLVVREDDCVVPRWPSHGAEASSSRAGLPAPSTSVVRLEQEQEPAGAPPAYFDEAQAE
jgi:hypothetical protein